MSTQLLQIATDLRSFKFNYSTEDELQEALHAALAEAGHSPIREVRLNRHDRIDLLVGGVGIEVKVAGSTGEVLRQLKRYTAHDAIDALILVTTCVRHGALAGAEIGKPFEVVRIGGLL